VFAIRVFVVDNIYLIEPSIIVEVHTHTFVEHRTQLEMMLLTPSFIYHNNISRTVCDSQVGIYRDYLFCVQGTCCMNKVLNVRKKIIAVVIEKYLLNK